MANRNVDVELVYGVSGGGKLSGESGKQIKADLQALVDNLASKKIPTIKIFFDNADLDRKIKEVKKKLQTAFGKGIGTNINVTTQTSKGKTGASTSKTTQEVTEQEKTYQALKKQINEAYKAQESFYKAKYTNSELYKKMSEEESERIMDFSDKIKEANITEEQRSSLLEQGHTLQMRNEALLQTQLQKSEVSYNKIIRQMDDWIQGNKELVSNNKDALALVKQMEDAIKASKTDIKEDMTDTEKMEVYKKQQAELLALFQKNTGAISQMGATTETTGQKFKKAFDNKFVSMLGAALITLAMRALKQVYDNVVKLDKAVTDLQIATGGTREETEALVKSYGQLAQEIGATTIEVAEAADTWLRQGYSIEETNELIKDTIMLSKLGQLSSEEAAKALTSAMKGYKKEVSEALEIVDKFTAVDMQAAIGAGDIATAMAETAASAEVAGIAMDKLIGYIATVGEVTQDGAESVGTFFKTLFARMGSIEAGVFVDSETGESLNDVEQVVGKIGIALRDENGEFRDFSQVLDEVAQKWDTLDSVSQHALATAFSGTRQQEKFIVLMENYGTALDYAAVAADSAGTAQSKYEDAVMSGIEAKLNSLTSAWQTFSSNLLDSALVKVFLDIVIAIANALGTIIGFADSFVVKAALIGAAVFAAVKVLNAALNMGKTGWLSFVATIKTGAVSLGQSLMTLMKNPTMWITLLITAMMTASTKAGKWCALIAAAILLVASTVTIALKIIDKGVKGFMTSNPIGWILLALTAVVTIIKTIIDLFKKPSYEDLKEAAKEAKEAWDEAADAVEEVKDKLEELQEKIDEINNKPNLTLVDKEEVALLEQQKTLLEQELKLKEKEEELAKKNAAKSSIAAYNKYKNQYINSGWDRFWGASDDTFEDRFNAYISMSQDEVNDYISQVKEAYANGEINKFIYEMIMQLADERERIASEYVSELGGLLSEFDYYIGEDLEDWQKEINSYLDDYYKTLDKYNVSMGNIATTWDSVLSRLKYSNATEALKALADDLNVTEESLRKLYSNNSNIKEFIDYLQQLGLFAWDDTGKIEGLVQQIRDLADGFKSVAPQDYLSILSTISSEYDVLRDMLDEIEDSGVLSYDTLKSLRDDNPLLFEQLKSSGDLVKGADGYTLSKNALSNYLQSIKDSYSETLKTAEEWEEKVRKAVEEGRANQSDLDSASKSVENAKNNLEELNVVLNTLERSDLIEEFTNKLEAQSDALEEQADKYKDIVDIRKELLETYQDEIDYQKTLAEKTKSVADLQTRLAVSRLDTSASGRAATRELESELTEAQEDLAEFNLDHAIEKLTTQLSDEYDEYKSFIDEQINAIEDAINNAASMTSDALREALKDGIPYEKHHTGGFVGGSATLQNNEEFAKLLKGELVVTPKQMSNFMGKTLPALEGGNGTNVVYQAPLITIQCENVNKDTLPELQKVVDKAVKKVKEEIDGVISRTGKKGNINKFNI